MNYACFLVNSSALNQLHKCKSEEFRSRKCLFLTNFSIVCTAFFCFLSWQELWVSSFNQAYLPRTGWRSVIGSRGISWDLLMTPPTGRVFQNPAAGLRNQQCGFSLFKNDQYWLAPSASQRNHPDSIRIDQDYIYFFYHHKDSDGCKCRQIIKVNPFEAQNNLFMLNSYFHFKMEIIVQLFPSGKIIFGMRQSHLFMAPAAARARTNAADAASVPGDDRAWCWLLWLPGWWCSLFQTQAAQTVLSREGPAMTRTAVLLGLMGIGMSGYSSRQLTLHCKPSSHLFRWRTWWKKSVHTYKCRLTLDQVSPKVAAT